MDLIRLIMRPQGKSDVDLLSFKSVLGVNWSTNDIKNAVL